MDQELIDDLIEEITVDAYGDEGYWAFSTAHEGLSLQPKAKIVGQTVELVKIECDGDERRGPRRRACSRPTGSGLACRSP